MASEPFPESWTEADIARLAHTRREEFDAVFPAHSHAQLRRWKTEAVKLRTKHIDSYREGKLPQEQIDLWVSKAELRKRKRQEYNEAMGLVHDTLAGQVPTEDAAHEKIATYLHKLSGDEDLFVTQRAARTVSLSAARELLLWRHIEKRIAQIAPKLRARPYGYARKKSAVAHEDRVVHQLWSDQHFGAASPADELPAGYDDTAQRRRFAYVLKNALEYKLDHRKRTTTNIYDAGDNMEGTLGHDLRSGEPLADQFGVLLETRIQATEHLAAQYPHVRIFLTPGNHDRNKIRHPGRATYQKWDSYQTMLGFAWRAACVNLPNVEFHISKQPHIKVEALGHWHFITHGDTHLNFGNPGSTIRIDKILAQCNSINASKRYGGPFKVFAGGHVHTSVQMELENFDLFINGALCPTSSYADALGYHGAASQWIWETTEKYSVGDMRRVSVDTSIDEDASLDELIKPVDLWG